jgi:poly(A) polymerase
MAGGARGAETPPDLPSVPEGMGEGLLPYIATHAARRIMQALMRTGQEARFVGGCVRDAVLGLGGGDVDIATPLPPEEVMRRLKQDDIRVIPTGLRHGTITGVIDGETFEITTLRRDAESFGRQARVEFTDDWQEDAARRDFTFNAMSLTLEGEFRDPFGGLADLRAGRVRFIGDAHARIAEDCLRILRFFRFHGRFGQGGPLARDLAACAAQAPLLQGLSGERVYQEVGRILELERGVTVWRLMIEQGVMAHLLPHATNMDRWAALDRLEWMLGEVSPLTRLAALLPGASEVVMATADRLRLSGVERRTLLTIVTPPCSVAPGQGMRERRLALQSLGAKLYREILLLAGAQSGVPAIDLAETLAEIDCWQPIPFPLKGQDALEAGLRPGPEVGRLLEGVEVWWAEHDYAPNRNQCLAEMRRRMKLAKS